MNSIIVNKLNAATTGVSEYRNNKGVTETWAYDTHGNTVYHSSKCGLSYTTAEYTYTYDTLGHMIERRSDITQSFNNERHIVSHTHDILVYNKMSQCIMEIDLNSGYTMHHSYDDDGNKISSKSESGGVEQIWVYHNGNLIRYEDNNGTRVEYEYNDIGCVANIYDSLNNEVGVEYYDINGNMTYCRDEQCEYNYRYDRRNNLIYASDTDGLEEFYKYDKHGNLSFYTTSRGYAKYYKYDDKNRLVSTIDTDDVDESFIY